jgi:hypothetical protein
MEVQHNTLQLSEEVDKEETTWSIQTSKPRLEDLHMGFMDNLDFLL